VIHSYLTKTNPMLGSNDIQIYIIYFNIKSKLDDDIEIIACA
jgi:hypothetical protein